MPAAADQAVLSVHIGPLMMATVDMQVILDKIVSDVVPQVGRGAVADYIPALASVDPHQFGIAVAGTNGELHGAGEWHRPFSVQSISKVFTLALVMSEDNLWDRVGREPSGTPFNSLVQLEHEAGIPRNPFINAGALVVTDHLMNTTSDSVGAVLDLLRRESADPDLDYDPVVADSEAACSDRTLALAHFLASYDNLHNSPADVVTQYVRHCAVAMSCRDLALAGRFLAQHGTLSDGTRLLTRGQAKRLNAIMLTCGTYDAAGEFAYRVGISGKSGVGGGILAVIPSRCAIAVWSPALDPSGNSVAGVAALDQFTTLTGWSVF